MGDFREVDVSGIVWRPTHRGVSASTPGGKITVQTPVARCRIEPMASTYSSGWTITLLFDENDNIHTDFQEFLRRLQASYKNWDKNTDGVLRNLSDAVYCRPNGYGCSFRFTAFSDAQFYNADSGQVQDPSAMMACSCVLQLQGVWTTPDRWGLRWKVVQVKQSTSRAPITGTIRHLASSQQHQSQQECMFPMDE